MTPALAALYTTCFGMPSSPAPEPKVTIFPYLFRFISGTTAWQKFQVPVRLIDISFSASSVEYSSGIDSWDHPAQLTSMSTVPSSPITFDTHRSTSDRSVISTPIATASPPRSSIFLTTSPACSMSRSAMTTRAPRAAN